MLFAGEDSMTSATNTIHVSCTYCTLPPKKKRKRKYKKKINKEKDEMAMETD
jgi:hypothetical protein|tara:strand:+ start:566 stop:721 length:156 start_codon:yes stop_codon:yes gene_type:complete